MQNPISCQFDVYEGILQPFTCVEGYIFQHISFSYTSDSFLKSDTSDACGIYLCVTFLYSPNFQFRHFNSTPTLPHTHTHTHFSLAYKMNWFSLLSDR